jgi:Methane oxygenase PmoA
MLLLKSIPARFLFILFVCSPFMEMQAFAQHFATTKTHEGIEISENGKKVLFYQQLPKSLDGKYARGGYVYPLYSLNQKDLTEDFPDDHPYHHGIFWAWHQVILNNKSIADGWTYENLYWKPIKLKIENKRKSITLYSEMIWQSVLGNNKLTDIIKENTTITVRASSEKYRVINFDILLSALVDTLQLGGSDDAKGYGGFCLRLKLPEDIAFFSGGSAIVPKETAVNAGPWMDFIGSFDGASFPKNGIAVFCKEPVQEDSQPWILRKEGSMQNIPFPGRTAVALPRKGWRLQYRLVIHNGEMSNDNLRKLYQDYIHSN